MEKDILRLLSVIGTCHFLMKEQAAKTRVRSDVKSAVHWCDMYVIDGAFRLAEYVDAEHLNGEATSWRLEFTVTAQNATVEADVRRIHGEGQDVLTEVGDYMYPTAEECLTRIVDITRDLCSINP